jgi:hypothetical protein
LGETIGANFLNAISATYLPFIQFLNDFLMEAFCGYSLKQLSLECRISQWVLFQEISPKMLQLKNYKNTDIYKRRQ